MMQRILCATCNGTDKYSIELIVPDTCPSCNGKGFTLYFDFTSDSQSLDVEYEKDQSEDRRGDFR